MARPAEYSFVRYLAAKKSVDDRALNRQVRESLRQALACTNSARPLQVLEVGCGIGTMAERLMEWSFLHKVRYTGIDLAPECLAEARRRLKRFAAQKNFAFRESGTEIELTGPGLNFLLAFEAAEALEFAGREAERLRWDLLIAQAFLDLVDLDTAIPCLLSLLRPGGWFYFPLNFDGATVLLPALDPELDRLIENLYHQSMDRRSPSGKISPGSHTGRRLFGVLAAAGAEVLAAGASDWVVFPQGRSYPEDEAYFLHFLIHTISQTLSGHPCFDPQTFDAWIEERHAQVETGRLIYLAHQLDFFGRVP